MRQLKNYFYNIYNDKIFFTKALLCYFKISGVFPMSFCIDSFITKGIQKNSFTHSRSSIIYSLLLSCFIIVLTFYQNKSNEIQIFSSLILFFRNITKIIFVVTISLFFRFKQKEISNVIEKIYIINDVLRKVVDQKEIEKVFLFKKVRKIFCTLFFSKTLATISIFLFNNNSILLILKKMVFAVLDNSIILLYIVIFNITHLIFVFVNRHLMYVCNNTTKKLQLIRHDDFQEIMNKLSNLRKLHSFFVKILRVVVDLGSLFLFLNIINIFFFTTHIFIRILNSNKINIPVNSLSFLVFFIHFSDRLLPFFLLTKSVTPIINEV